MTSGRNIAARRYIAIAVIVLGLVGLSLFLRGPSSARNSAEPVLAEPAPAAVRTDIRTGVFTSGQARRGDKVYAEHCSSCHLPSMTGKEPAPALAGIPFMSRWRGSSVGDLYARTAATMPVGNAGVLSPEQYTDLVALILEANNFPPGNEELKADRDYLTGIKIL